MKFLHFFLVVRITCPFVEWVMAIVLLAFDKLIKAETNARGLQER